MQKGLNRNRQRKSESRCQGKQVESDRIIDLTIIFTEKPSQWGLRGDPFLWDAIKDWMMKKVFPASRNELESLLKEAFEEITAASLDSTQTIYIERFDKGGMSGGQISADFWKERGIPLLLDRFDLLQIKK